MTETLPQGQQDLHVTRIYIQDSKMANLTHVPPSLFTEPNEVAQYLPFKEAVCEKLVFPERIDQNPTDFQENEPVE